MDGERLGIRAGRDLALQLQRGRVDHADGVLVAQRDVHLRTVRAEADPARPPAHFDRLLDSVAAAVDDRDGIAGLVRDEEPMGRLGDDVRKGKQEDCGN